MGITPERTIAINEIAWDYWRYQATTDEDWTRDYLARRGLRGIQPGRAPDSWDRMVKTLRKKGVDDAELEAAGLARRSGSGAIGDFFRDRLVLPIRNQDDRIIGFTARRNPVNDPGPGEDGPPKYLNTATTPVFEKHQVLYGLDAAAVRRLAAGASPTIVEGALDVEAAKRAGPNYVPLAPLGTAITPAHLEVLRGIDATSIERLILAMDPDEGGVNATVRLWEMLDPVEAGEARAAVMPLDPADMLRYRRIPEMRAALDTADPMSHVVVDHKLTGFRLDEIEGYVAAARTITSDLARLEPLPMARAAMHLAKGIGHEHLDLVIAETVTAVRGDRPVQEPQRPAAEITPVRDVVADAVKVRTMNGHTTPLTPVRAAPSQEPGPAPPAHRTIAQQNPTQAPSQER